MALSQLSFAVELQSPHQCTETRWLIVDLCSPSPSPVRTDGVNDRTGGKTSNSFILSHVKIQVMMHCGSCLERGNVGPLSIVLRVICSNDIPLHSKRAERLPLLQVDCPHSQACSPSGRRMRSVKGAIIDKNEAIKEREKNLINESCRILVHSIASDATGAVWVVVFGEFKDRCSLERSLRWKLSFYSNCKKKCSHLQWHNFLSMQSAKWLIIPHFVA